MSFFYKFNNNTYSNKIDIKESIKNQISLIFENRSDLYYSYNFQEKEIVPIHRLHRLSYGNPAYIDMLNKIIKTIDTRIEEVESEIIDFNNIKKIKIKLKLIPKYGLLNFAINI